MKTRRVNIDLCWAESTVNRASLRTDIKLVPVWKDTRKEDIEYTIKELTPGELTHLAEVCARALVEVRATAARNVERVAEVVK